MFCSHKYMSRKGPYGKPWKAAHCQKLLNKSDYTDADIPKIASTIMNPDVPLALRTSSDLLLGVVQMYSKKVDYVLQDYNLTTLLAQDSVSTQVDLSEHARLAPVEKVTLPEAINLDDLDLDYDDTLEWEFDHHLGREEDITLTDQYPTGVDPYVAITFEEDIIPETSPMDVDQCTVPVSGHPGETDVEMAYGAEPNNDLGGSTVSMDTEDYGPRNDTEEIPEFQDPTPSNLTNSAASVPEIEKRRDAAHGLSPASHPPFAAQQQEVRVERTETLDETLNEKETTIPSLDEQVSHSRGYSTFELRSGSPGFAGSEEEHANFALQPTTPPLQQTRPRKRTHFDDKAIVLTNKVMKNRLEDPSVTLCKRKKMPLSYVGIWRLNNQSKKDQIFMEPLFTGFSNVLRSLFKKDIVKSKPYLAVFHETLPEPSFVSSPTRDAETEINQTSPVPQSLVPESTDPGRTVQLSPGRQTEDVQDYAVSQSARAESAAREARSPHTFNNDDMEIERFRDGGFPGYMMSPPPRSSTRRTDDFITQRGTSQTGACRTEPSDSTNQGDLPGSRNSVLPATPEIINEELYFLDLSGNTPRSSPASQDSDALSVRTRYVAKYLKERSSNTPTSSSYYSGDLSLNEILTGKTRKLAARMFFETLVLRFRGLIDLQQDQPYSDIALKLKPALFSKVQL